MRRDAHSRTGDLLVVTRALELETPESGVVSWAREYFKCNEKSPLPC